jgi:guanyl-specific ribonuclease Sa
MRPARFPLWRLVFVLLAVAGGVLARGRGGERNTPQPVATPAAKADGSPREVAERGRERRVDLSAVESKEHRGQILKVIEAMDATGAPPSGVAQGGRRGGRKGVFQNAGGLLPRRPAGYWVESDVWPKKGPRDAERLIFGREGEVYWTRDHYESFVQLR